MSRFARVLVGTVVISMGLGGLAVSSAAAVEDLGPTISVGGTPRHVTFSPDATRAYVSNDADDTVSVIDTVTNASIDTIAVGDEPLGLAVSPDGLLVYVANFNDATVSVIDTSTDTVTHTISVGTGTYNVAFGKDGLKAYVVNYTDATSFPSYTGTVSVIDVATATVTTTLSTYSYPEGIAISPDGTFAYISLVDGTMRRITLATNVVSPAFANPGFPTEVVFSKDGTHAYTSNNGDNTVAVIDTALDQVISTIPIDGNYPTDIDITPDGSTVWVSFGRGAVEGIQPIDVATNTAGARIQVGDGHTGVQGVAVSPAGNMIYVTNYNNSTVSIIADPVTRTSGVSRYLSAIAVSQTEFPAGARTVVIATGENYPDALSAGPAATRLHAPLLLTSSNSLPQAVKDEIVRLHPNLIIIVGGSGVVSGSVYNALVPLATTVERIFGVDRYETSRNIAEQIFGSGGAHSAFIATGRNFPDALSASAYGAASGAPVILVDGSATSVSQATLDTFTFLGTTSVRIAGGTGVVSAGIKNDLTGAGFIVSRSFGANRYDTSLAINSLAYPNPGDAQRVLIATGTNFPDALAGSAWAGKIKAPLFIVPGTCIPSGIYAKIVQLGAIQVTLIGGTGVLTQSVFNLTVCP